MTSSDRDSGTAPVGADTVVLGDDTGLTGGDGTGLTGDDTVRGDDTGLSADDMGLFGPGSVTWRVHAEPILWLAGFRALLLQMLLPQALAGVLQNSNFRADPWGRLFRTARFYGEVVYGPTAVAEAAGARVRKIHSYLSGVDPATGEAFRVDEPDLLLWVYVTATESFCDTAQRSGLGLSPAEVDRYYDEQRTVARLVGLDVATVPANAAEVDSYYEQMRPVLHAGADARATARFLALPTFPWGLGWTPVRPLWIGVATYGFSLLPRWARRIYGLPGLPGTDLATTMTARVIRSAVRALPTRALEGPLYRAAMARTALIPETSTIREAANHGTSIHGTSTPAVPAPVQARAARSGAARSGAARSGAARSGAARSGAAGSSASSASTVRASKPRRPRT